MPSTLIRRIAAATLAIALGATLAGCSILDDLTGRVMRDDEGAVIDDNANADVWSIKTGDCLNDSAVAIDAEVETLPIVTCDQPHDTEVFLTVSMDDAVDAEFPGDDVVAETADSACYEAFSEYIGLSYEESLYDFAYYQPTAESWAFGNRDIYCIVFDPNGPITGTLEGAAA